MIAALVVATAGCGTTSTGTAQPQPMPPPTSPPPTSGGAEIVVQFSTGGGIDGPCCRPSVVPEITLYGDGRVVFTEGTVGLMPGLRQVTIGAAGVDELRNRVGTLGKPDTGTLCCDLPYTRVVTGAAEFSVVGLGHEGTADLTDEQRQNRGNVTALRDRLDTLVKEAGGYGGYAPAELAVYVTPGSSEPGVPWPLASPLAEGCVHITSESRTVVAAARKVATPFWTSAGKTWHVTIRPLLPHEHGCA